MRPHENDIGRFAFRLFEDGLDDISGLRNHLDIVMLAVDGRRDEISKCVLRRRQDVYIKVGFDLGRNSKITLHVQDRDSAVLLSGDPQRVMERASRNVGKINRTEHPMEGTHAVIVRNAHAKAWRLIRSNVRGHTATAGRVGPAEGFEMKDGVQDETC